MEKESYCEKCNKDKKCLFDCIAKESYGKNYDLLCNRRKEIIKDLVMDMIKRGV